MIAQFVNTTMGGKKIPSFEELFPKFTEDIESKEDKEFKDTHNGLTRNEWNRMMLAKQQFKDFAKRRNEKLAKKGET